jgi:uncharacterized SAM-binding protein YcdF (DUF218 family)
LLLLSGLLLWLRRARKLSAVLIAAGTSAYLLFSSGPVAHFLLGSLEYAYPAQLAALPTDRPQTIVVLSAYGQDDASIPLSSRVNGSGLFRLVEAHLIATPRRGDRIIVSGGGENARVMRDILLALGVPPQAITLEELSQNTYQSALHLRPLLGEQPFYLVTSAGHMPRAMGVFQKQGAHPIAVPTDYFAARNVFAVSPWPAAHNLALSDLAIHEYIGRFWYWLNDRL